MCNVVKSADNTVFVYYIVHGAYACYPAILQTYLTKQIASGLCV